MALAAEDCDTAVTLDCLRGLYNFDFTPVSGDKNSVAVGKHRDYYYVLNLP